MTLTDMLMNLLFKTVLFLIIPFIWWFKNARKQSSFFEYVGIKKTVSVNKNHFRLTVSLTLIFILFVPTLYYIFYPDIFSSSGERMSFWLLAYVLIIRPVYSTGFLEEVGFRGFLGKRLIGRFGFAIGNSLQALIFGVAHINLSMSFSSVVFVIAVTGGLGWIFGYITEKQAGGSINYAWALHAFANFPLFQFVLFRGAS